PPRPPRVSQLIAAARELLETEGHEALTMRRLGQAIGIRAPSIYKHLPDKRAVEVALIEAGLDEMGDVLHRAVAQAGDETAVAALLGVYRAQALAHPNLYRLATGGPLPRADLTPGLEDWAGEPFLLVTGDPFVAQGLWAFAHGMVILELDGRFPDDSDLERTWQAGAAALTRRRRGRPLPTLGP
ncbi:MAG TPA: WHG domain-containing protein, partial [Acidimicrobiales bacterium]